MEIRTEIIKHSISSKQHNTLNKTET